MRLPVSESVYGAVQRDYVLAGGNKIYVPVPTLLWEDTGYKFVAGDGARRRHHKTEVDLGVLHWTGSENDIPRLYKTLDTRELGVEFAIDKAGVIWQFCDPVDIDTFDAGKVNPRSWGCETVGYGRKGMLKLLNPDPNRPTYPCRINGKKFRAADYYPVQQKAANALCDAMAIAFPKMLKQVPTGPDGLVLDRTMTPAELKAFRGVVGHFHVSNQKQDPGTQPLVQLAAHWREAA